ncbi:hypothetical protein LBBP_00153 [Leptospira borgpetersenii serovar Ballum]|uniref:Uncharacterized protein n=1 Tax=Leptospira borgpetersenii serovar Ballum TaxID=280505 RepID=A0A0S2ILH9_LEPBO|nr:hypothetical protein LBBP_00153 [Leptospira borgpetersenii serovar Ballum]
MKQIDVIFGNFCADFHPKIQTFYYKKSETRTTITLSCIMKFSQDSPNSTY